MLKEGYKAQEIADALHVHNSTIYREIKRGLTVQRTSELVDREVYCPDTAQRKYEESKSVHGPDLKSETTTSLPRTSRTRSSTGIFARGGACEINEEGKIFSVTISEWTLYRYIDKGVFLNITNKDLPMHGEHKKTTRKYTPAGRRRATASRIGRKRSASAPPSGIGRWIASYLRAAPSSACWC